MRTAPIWRWGSLALATASLLLGAWSMWTFSQRDDRVEREASRARARAANEWFELTVAGLSPDSASEAVLRTTAARLAGTANVWTSPPFVAQVDTDALWAAGNLNPLKTPAATMPRTAAESLSLRVAQSKFNRLFRDAHPQFERAAREHELKTLTWALVLLVTSGALLLINGRRRRRVALAQVLGVALLAASFAAPAANAQAARVQLRGTVRTANTDVALSGAVVELSRAGASFRVRSDDRGEFSVRDVPTGRYLVNVMRIGYLPYRDSLTVDDNPPRLKVVLTGNVQELQAIAVRANVTAVYGGIGVAGRSKNAQGERPLFPVPEASVQVLGSGRSVKTDTAGRFFIELGKPGAYIVRVSGAGLKDEMYNVEVPKNTAIDASRLLDSSNTQSRTGYATLVNEMDRRIRMRGMASAVVSGEELREKGGSIADALTRTKSVTLRGLQIGGSTCVFVDGIPKPNLSIESIRLEEVAAIEVYADRGDASGTVASSWPPGANCGTNNRRGPSDARTIPIVRYALVWTVP